MLKLFIGPEKDGVGIIRLLAKYRGINKTSSQLFQPVNVPVEDIFCIVNSISDADAILFPHDYASVKNDDDFIATYEKLSEVYNKKIIVFSVSDRDIFVLFKNAIILRTSAYRYKLRSNEIIVAPFIEDMGLLYGVSVRHKTNASPIVGFAGLAQWWTIYARVKAYVKQFLLSCRVLYTGRKEIRAHTQGIFIRRQALRALGMFQGVRLCVIIRNSFSGLARTINVSQKQLRDEYVEIMQQSDFCLAPKGDGNYSLRFFETLALGRIPVLVDTETVLPFEDKINYDNVIIRVPLRDIKSIGNIIANTYMNMTDEDFVQRQHYARKIFEDFLRPEKFYAILFSELATQFHSG